MPSRVTRGFADTSVGQVHYRTARPHGTVSTRPLVMFHGSPSSSTSLSRLVSCLGDRRVVIAFDTMGQGDSCPPPSAEVTFEDYARFYAEALTSLGPAFDRVDLFGTHTGARIAAEFAIAYPARTGKLILDGMRRGPSEFWHEYAASLDLSQDIDEDGTQFHKAVEQAPSIYSFSFRPIGVTPRISAARGCPIRWNCTSMLSKCSRASRGRMCRIVLPCSIRRKQRLPLIRRPTLSTARRPTVRSVISTMSRVSFRAPSQDRIRSKPGSAIRPMRKLQALLQCWRIGSMSRACRP